MVQRYGVEHRVWFRLTPQITARSIRAYRGQPARVEYDRDTPVEVCVDTATWEATMRRVGWRVYGTNQPAASLARAQAVVASRSA